MNAVSLKASIPSLETTPQAALVELQAQIYQEVRDTGRPVGQLMIWLLDRRNLDAAWDRVQRTAGADTPGADGVSCADLRGQSAAWLIRLADDLYHGRYRPLPPRWVEVPKPNKPGAVRRLGILTVRDRVVHAALKQILEPILEPTFLPSSFGFRPGRSVPAALAAALRLLTPGTGAPLPFSWAVHVDVADCFDTVDHRLLLAGLARHVADNAFLRLLEQVLEAGGTTVSRFWWRRCRGLVQGSALSPLLCNLYLHPLDQGLAELRQATHQGVRALRYADDLLLLARDERLGRRAIAVTRQVLARLQQRLRDAEAVPCPVQEGIDWLGVRLQPRAHGWTGQTTFGYVIPDAKVIEMLQRLDEMTVPPSERIDVAAFNPARWIVSINEQLRDWRQAYLFADNAAEVFRAIDDHSGHASASCCKRSPARAGRSWPSTVPDCHAASGPGRCRGPAWWCCRRWRRIALPS